MVGEAEEWYYGYQLGREPTVAAICAVCRCFENQLLVGAVGEFHILRHPGRVADSRSKFSRMRSMI
jgi:hypothetical protein